MKTSLFCALLVVFAVPSFSQDHTGITESSASLGAGIRDGNLTLSTYRLWPVGVSERFHIGLGIRYTGYLGNNQDFITAPAIITSGRTGPLVLFTENINANIDTFLIQSAVAHSLNLAIDLRHQISRRLSAGFNIDLIGGTFGNHARGNYINGNRGKRLYSHPTAFNILLISDNDRGSLNSEFYVTYIMNSHWNIKGGFQFLFTEYTTEEAVQTYPQRNDRFRNKSLMVFAGASYKLSQPK